MARLRPEAALSAAETRFEVKTMKYVIAFFLLCSAGALAQATGTVLNSQAQPLQFQYNPRTATQQPLAAERSVLFSNGYTVAQGERPVSDFLSSAECQSLGDVARALKQDQAQTKKSDVVYVNY